MGQYQTRSKSVDEDHGGRITGGAIPVPGRQEEVPPPLAPVFGSPIESKLTLYSL